jgi:hypothetical protein
VISWCNDVRSVAAKALVQIDRQPVQHQRPFRVVLQAKEWATGEIGHPTLDFVWR